MRASERARPCAFPRSPLSPVPSRIERGRHTQTRAFQIPQPAPEGTSMLRPAYGHGARAHGMASHGMASRRIAGPARPRGRAAARRVDALQQTHRRQPSSARTPTGTGARGSFMTDHRGRCPRVTRRGGTLALSQAQHQGSGFVRGLLLPPCSPGETLPCPIQPPTWPCTSNRLHSSACLLDEGSLVPPHDRASCGIARVLGSGGPGTSHA